VSRLKFFIPIVLLLSYNGISQTILRGKVIDSVNTPLSFATIQVLDSTQTTIITYGITDKEGKYFLEISEKGTYHVKASFLGFRSLTKRITSDSDDLEIEVNFTLQESEESLKEVIIDYDPSFAKIKKDTIVYNLDRALNGQEQNLKDVLEKLPGVEIDANGKIKVKGKQVENLLIDGEPFFNNQHQLATENINSEMVGGVAFFEKYKDFTNFEGFEDNKGTALNISIKDSFKNRVTGSIEALSGHERRYTGHTNLFRFGKKLKLTFIGDINNVGQESITLNDYIELSTNVAKYRKIGGSSTTQREISNNEIPIFLNNTDDVEERKITLGALNFVYKPLSTLKFSGFSILNETSQDQFFSTNRFFLDQPNSNQFETRETNGDYLFGSTFFNIDYKVNPKSLLNYTLTYNPRRNSQNNFVGINTTVSDNAFDEITLNNGFKLGQQLSFVKNIKEDLLLSLSGITEFSTNDNDLTIEGTEDFLSLTFQENAFLFENRSSRKNQYGISVSLEKKKKQFDYSFNSSIDWIEERFENRVFNIIDNSFTHDLERNIRNISFSGNINYKINDWLNVNGSLGYANYNINSININNTIDRVLPGIGSTINFNQKNQLSISYGLTNKFINLKNTINGNLINNYLSLDQGLGINTDELFNTNTVNLIFSSIQPLKGNSLIYILNFTDQNNDIVTNAITAPEGFFINEYFLNNTNRRLLTSLNIQRRLLKSKFSLNLQSTLLSQRYNNLIEGNRNITNLTNFKQQLVFFSNYKKALNFKLGGEFIYNDFANSFRDNAITSLRIEPYLEIIGTHFEKRLYWNLTSKIQHFSSNNNDTRTIFLLNPNLNYTTKSKKWTYFLKGRNIFNIESPEVIQNINRTNFFEERIGSSLSGYIGIGAKYNF